jgi:aspartate-semialdehyde dehydrogenase
VLHGHTAVVSVEFERAVTAERVLEAWCTFRAPASVAALPSAPERPVVYLDEEDRPQPRRDAERGGGMVVFVGRLRPCPILGFKFVVLGHNTLRGAAGAAVLNAELLATTAYMRSSAVGP